jgi:hypothetical protein
MSRIPLLLCALLTTPAGPLLAQATPEAAGNPPGRVARLSLVSNNVSFQASGDTAWSAATLNYPVTTGDRLYADRGARAELQVGPFAVRLSEATDLLMTNLTDELMQLGFTQGALRISVYQLAPGDSVEVDTPHGALALLAPGVYRVDAPPGDTVMVVSVTRGTLEWTAGGVAQLVQAGEAIRLAGVNPIQVASVPVPAPDAFDKWSDGRDARGTSSQSLKYVSRDIPGYDDLDDAGRWEVDAGYGPVWYPTVIPVGWVPYRYGHWVWVEPWGWTWVEHARWGYAPFHYGRWAHVRGRWGWIPGPVVVRPYYAPALVVFVNGSGFSAQAWFPLGPDEPYYPWYHHNADYQRHVNLTNIRRVTNVRYITDVTYINRIPYRNRAVGMTAVPTSGFQARGPIAGRVIRVPDDRIARAPILPHPTVMPTPRAVEGGYPVSTPPRVRRPSWVTAPPPRPAPPVRVNAPLVVRRDVPAPRPDPVLITRRPPPPPDVPFAERQKAMQPDPGRPLAPRQIENLRAGRPAGPRVAPDTPARPAESRETPPPRQTTPAAPKPRAAAPAPPPRQPTPTPSKKGEEPERRRRP